MLRDATKHIPNARVTCFSGLLNEFCRQEKAPFIVRGLRAFSDFEYEFQRALQNNIVSFFMSFGDDCFLFFKQSGSAFDRIFDEMYNLISEANRIPLTDIILCL